jgi:hypothetical protein
MINTSKPNKLIGKAIEKWFFPKVFARRLRIEKQRNDSL